MNRAAHTLLMIAEFTLGTWLVGWWGVPVLAVVHGLAAGELRAPGRWAALAAVVAWGGLLLAFGLAGFPLGALAGRLSALLQLPPAGLYAVTLLLPALLAGSGAALGGALRAR